MKRPSTKLGSRVSHGPASGSSGSPFAWHARPADEAIEALGSSQQGLTGAEADRRLDDHGPNELPARDPESLLSRIARQFKNVLIYVLLAAAAFSMMLGEWVDSVVILAVVVANAVVGFVQEGRAERSLDAIRRMVSPSAAVIRDAHRLSLPATEIVPGDLVLLKAGDRVPADLRVIRADNLRADEAVLTGESAPVDKSPAPVPADAELGDRHSMLYSGTLVAAGQGVGLAVSTGAGTELGRISGMIEQVEMLETPLLRQMNVFSRRLTVLILGVAALAFAYAAAVAGYPWPEAFMIVVGLAVAAVPEALPAVLTITLAIGVQRMAARNAIIRRLPAVETLGALSVACSDKTGTLTRNEMTARTLLTPAGEYVVSGQGYDPAGKIAPETGTEELVQAALLCNDAELVEDEEHGWRVHGDPMEGALVVLARKAGLKPGTAAAGAERRETIPFSSDYKYMATRHADGTIYVKGAPEVVIELCSGDDGDDRFDAAWWTSRADRLATEGQRVLAFAIAKRDTEGLDHDDLRGARFLGLAGFIDPPRAESRQAVLDCRSAGVRVVMITGDHAATAREIARQLEIAAQPSVLTGRELDELDEEEFRQAARATDVFARTTPAHKLRLVEALQQDDRVVAMTGDGVNDAPALRRADVGIAMGIKGTEASKEAAEMVLADDNFASISAAIREGRTVYDNLRKVIAWTLPTNGGEALIILVALAIGATMPITPVQILWINLVTASSLGLTLAFEPTEPGVMQRPPRKRSESLLTGGLAWQIAFVSVLMVAGSFGSYAWASDRGLSLEAARTMAVNAIVVMEIFYLFSVRYVHGTSLTLRGALGTRAVLIGIAIVALAQLVFTYWTPMHVLFGSAKLGAGEGAFVVMVGIALLLVVEVEKIVRGRLMQRSSERQQK